MPEATHDVPGRSHDQAFYGKTVGRRSCAGPFPQASPDDAVIHAPESPGEYLLMVYAIDNNGSGSAGTLAFKVPGSRDKNSRYRRQGPLRSNPSVNAAATQRGQRAAGVKFIDAEVAREAITLRPLLNHVAKATTHQPNPAIRLTTDHTD